MTELFKVQVPLRLALEAETIEEARAQLFRLWQDCCENLPVGAGAFEKEHSMVEHLTINTFVA